MCFDFRDVPSAGFLCFFGREEGSFSSLQRYFGGSLGAPPPFQHRICEAQECRPTDFVPHRRKTVEMKQKTSLTGESSPRDTVPPSRGVCWIFEKHLFSPVFYSRSWFQASLRAISLQVSPASDPKFLPILTCACATLLKSLSVHTLIKNKQIKKTKRQSLLQIKLWWGRFPSPHHSTKRQQLLWETNTTVSIFWQYLRCVGRELI